MDHVHNEQDQFSMLHRLDVMAANPAERKEKKTQLSGRLIRMLFIRRTGKRCLSSKFVGFIKSSSDKSMHVLL
jgi:hypothetical protein